MSFVPTLLPSFLVAVVVSLVVHGVFASDVVEPRRLLRLVRVQIVHRHGDRTPITPLRDEAFWRSTLPSAEMLERLGEGTTVVRGDGAAATHAAGGRGAFGQLTTLGVLQMVELGERLREELFFRENEDDDVPKNEDDVEIVEQDGVAFALPRRRPLLRRSDDVSATLRVWSTDFPRTLQSVRGLLVGLLDDVANDDERTRTVIPIDARHTSILIPDPQPRRTEEQAALERELAVRPHVLEREKRMRPLAVKITDGLRRHDLLGDGHEKTSFGVGEEKVDDDGDDEDSSSSTAPLAWTQLAEITKCLAVRDLLPPDVCTPEERETLLDHVARRWFDSLSHDRLATLAMRDLVCELTRSAFVSASRDDDRPRALLYSAHDSTLVGLLCALRLERPPAWPPYGSCLRMETWESTDVATERYARFSLNGEPLRCGWGRDANGSRAARELVPSRALSDAFDDVDADR